MCSPPLFISVEEARDGFLRAPQCLGPAIEQATPLVGELVGPLGRARNVGTPLGADEPFLLEGAQEPVEVADVDAALHSHLGKSLEQLVAMEGPLPQQQEQRRFDEALDAGGDVPVPGPDEPAAAGAWAASVGARASIGKRHMFVSRE